MAAARREKWSGVKAVPAPVAAPEPVVEAVAPDPLRFVRVRNEGARAWIGSDYPPGKVDVIHPGESAEVTERRAAELVVDYKHGLGGVGPFAVGG